MKRILCVICGVLLAAFAAQAEEQAETKAEALSILNKVDAAIKAVNAVRYTASTKVSGAAEQFAAPAEGEVIMIGWNNGLPQKFYTYVKTTKPGAEDKLELTGGGNGDSFFLVDHTGKKGYEDMDPGVLGSSGNTLRSIGMLEFVHDHPYDDELGAEGLELLGEEDVAGEPCHTIRVIYSGGQGESIWSFSKKDFLPRKRIRKFSGRGGEGALENTISKLVVDPQIDPSMFKMKLPQGYEQIDDFAP